MLSLQDLKNTLDFNQLPGHEAHIELAPPTRVKNIAVPDKNNFRVAAVLILLYKENGVLKFPTILRNIYPGVHSNQIGFPGGQLEKTDLNLEQTAIRETSEEINAKIEPTEILGALTPIYIPPSNFMVYPYLGYYHNRMDFKANPEEVQEIIPIEVNSFLNTNIKYSIVRNGVEAPCFELENKKVIWGATAMILNEFRVFVKKSLPSHTS